VPAHAATVADLSKQLSVAVQSTLPPGGVIPEVKPGLWNPNLTNP
jgi:iduronate 2-sulfatase